jgi:hypothetical protein
MRLGFCAAAIASLALSGCVSPLVRPNELATQYKATNAIDWQEMAKRTVAAIPTSMSGPRTSVYVEEGPRDSRFYAIYRRYLQQELYAQNYPVLRSPEGAGIILRTDTDWVLHDKAGKRITDYATLWTTASGFFGQFRHISSVDTGYAAGIGTGILYDFLASLNGTTRAEVVVTSTIVSSQTNNLHFVRSETIYVEPTELTYYMDALPPVSLPVTQTSNR